MSALIAQARAIVANPQPEHSQQLRALAWAALMHKRGGTISQRNINAAGQRAISAAAMEGPA
jgi:hypothetical protein